MKIVDPLAQSFYVQQSSGYFVTSVDLYFYSKDNDLPVTVQLRPMELGLPTQTIYPYAEVVLEPSQVVTSSDASLPTRVTFESPVYLLGERFHALVVLANSTSYKLWVSKLGGLDITSGLSTESRQVVVTKQPLAGGLFKSQNGLTWTESGLEDLKFSLYRANFTADKGNVNFYNSELDIGNLQIANLPNNSIEMNSRKIRVGLGTTVQDSGLTIGNTIIQLGSNATGNYVGYAGTTKGNLTLINPGIGYTPASGSFTHSGVALTSITGNGRDATANITTLDGVAIAATISNGGTGYSVGDVLSAIQIGSETLGRNLRFSVSELSGTNQLIIDNVQGEFLTGVGKTIQYINSSGVTTTLNSAYGGNVLILNDGIQVENDGLHIRVNHKNHGMHAGENVAKISDVLSDVKPTRLLNDYSISSTANILIENSTDFSTFENVGVGTTNPGYALIGREIIAYTGTTANTLTGITRGIDQTSPITHFQGDSVYKYELNGISLRRINTTHALEDATISNPIDLDYYTLKIDTSQDGKTGSLPNGQVDRSIGTNFPKLYANTSKSTGGSIIKATQNIQFEIAKPIIQTLVLNGTNITSKVRTVTGTSVNGEEFSFIDSGFQDLKLNANNYFNTPRLVCSKVNEDNRLSLLPGKKSLTVSLNLSSSNELISPCIDLDRVGMVFTTNRINAPIQDYVKDNRSSTLENDPSSFVYAVNPIGLEFPASSLKLLVSAYVTEFSDIRAFYSVSNEQVEETDSLIYYPFPGFNNLNASSQVIDPSKNDGSSDKMVPKSNALGFESNQIVFKDYEFTVDNLTSFRYFSIKILGTSSNQCYPPRLKDLRVIALA